MCRGFHHYIIRSDIYLGILISGGLFSGDVGLSSAEVYIPGLNMSCLLPNMTTSRHFHSQNNLLACSGFDANTTCEVFTPGVGWRREPYNLEERYDHVSWTLNNGNVVLLGGKGSSANTAEIITQGVGTVSGFNLHTSRA